MHMGTLTKGNNLKNLKVVNNQVHKCDDIAFVTIMVVSVKGSTCRCLSIDEENNKTCRQHGPFSKTRIIHLRPYCKINYKYTMHSTLANSVNKYVW